MLPLRSRTGLKLLLQQLGNTDFESSLIALIPSLLKKRSTFLMRDLQNCIKEFKLYLKCFIDYYLLIIYILIIFRNILL